MRSGRLQYGGLEPAGESHADHPEDEERERNKLRQEIDRRYMHRAGQKSRQPVGEGGTRCHHESEAHAPQMPCDARRARNPAGENHFRIRSSRNPDHQSQNIHRDQHRTLDRSGALEKQWHSGRQLETHHGEGNKKTENDREGDFLGQADDAFRASDRQPRRHHQIKYKCASEKIGDLARFDNREIDGERGHDEHGREEYGSCRTMNGTTLGGECGN